MDRLEGMAALVSVAKAAAFSAAARETASRSRPFHSQDLTLLLTRTVVLLFTGEQIDQ
jgi:hypothetical protein